MVDLRAPDRPTVPAGRLARLLVVAFGLVGFMVTPAATTASAATASAGIGVRAGTAQNAPVRGRVSSPRPDPRLETAAGVVAAARQITGTPAQVPQAALPESGSPIRPPAGRIVRPVMAPAPPVVAPRAVPRGRAPPLSTRI
ncbi:hypothetical protein [Actinomadura macra]|uniref:hypothetical protein n=1 Tax=Actinomadura macra TaxID=46164 RepID=UPI00082FBBEA|nr:hypothetical protein [Actinomadura macra]